VEGHVPELAALELKAFVFARDFELSKQFYQDLGFTLEWDSEALAGFSVGQAKFLLTNYFVREAAEQMMLHLLVPDVEVWFARIQQQKIGEKYGVHIGAPEDRPWGIRDMTIADPSSVLWRIGHEILAPV
jgi:catechol 2,3-dioxygenase-like lactoylglutathione lyase family enzyme